MSAFTQTAPVKEGEVLAAKYRIEGIIGVGGMGIVVSAMHLELDQRVALKFLLPQAQLSDELVGRFVREAKASVRLKGKHVAQVLDVGRMDDGRAYIVMEYLEGRDLGAELKASTDEFAIDDAVSWMLQACEGLAEAHALGIVHRDLKPGNLFLTRGTDGRPLVKVLDFGISKSINPNSSDMLSLTKTEMLLGSPLYMAPEQMRSSKYVDERSDIWALGAIAYELFTRKVPFEADTLLDLCFKVAQEGCIPVHEVRPEVPEELSAVVMKCLEKEASARFHDIGQLATALEVFATDHDRGSAARTIAVLASGTERARARAEQISSPNVGPGEADAKRTSDAKRISDAKKISSSSSKSKPRPILEGQPINGTATTERAPASPLASSTSTDDAAAEDTDASAPDAVPASSAWGTTNASEIDKKKSRRSMILIGGAVAATAVIAFIVARSTSGGGGDSSSQSVAPTSSTVIATPPPPSASATTIITPLDTTTAPPIASSAAAAASASASASAPPTIHVGTAPTHVATRPKASASASSSVVTAPKPPDSSGFIRERE